MEDITWRIFYLGIYEYFTSQVLPVIFRRLPTTHLLPPPPKLSRSEYLRSAIIIKIIYFSLSERESAIIKKLVITCIS